MERLPGLFHLGLNASQETNSKNLSYRIKVMNKLKRDIPGKFTFSAASNLLGVFLFYNNRICEAIQEFKTVLSLDEYNINALENLIFIYQRLQMSKESYFYEQKKNDLEISDKARAIHLSEQGFAYRFDCHVEKDELERCKKSIDLFHESMNLLSEEKQKVEINFWLIQCLQQKFNACVRRGDNEGKWECYNAGIRLIKENIITLEQSLKWGKEQECSNTDVLSRKTSGLSNSKETLEETKTDNSNSEKEDAEVNIVGVKQEQTFESDCSNTDDFSQEASGLSNTQETLKETKTEISKSEKEPVYFSSLKKTNLDMHACNCNGDIYWKAMTLTWLGIYLSKHPESYWNETGKLVPGNDLPGVVEDCGFDHYFSDPESCFKEAVELMDTVKCKNEHHGDGSECRIRYAIFLRNRNKNLDHAVALLDKVISRDTASIDWFALTTRSQINEKRARQAKENDNEELGKQLIQDAIQDAEKCQAIQQSASEFARTGALYHFKAKYHDSQEEKEMSKLKASENFLYAVQSIREEKRPEIHRMHGRFFNAFDEHRQAIECFKRGIASDTAERETFTFKLMFETFLSMRKGKNNVEDMKRSTNDKTSSGVDPDLTNENDTDERTSETNLTLTDNVVTDVSVVQHQNISVVHPDVAVKNATGEIRPKIDLALTDNIVTDSSVVQNQNVLYEMVYWFKFAYERYGRPVESHNNGGENHHRKKVMSDMKKIVKKFTSDHKHEMSDIAAYFKVVLGHTVICDYITDCSEGGEEWEEMIRKTTEKWTNKHPHTPTNVTTDPCPLCGNSNQNIKRQISVFPGSHDKPRNLKYQYDFYIIYSKKDADWVLYYLLTGLETTYGFKGAIAEREYNPGSSIFSEINRLCVESFKVLLILSDNFIKDPLCSYAMTQAMNKQVQENSPRDENYIIPIKLSRCTGPPQVEALHALNAFPDLDWEKLASILEPKL